MDKLPSDKHSDTAKNEDATLTGLHRSDETAQPTHIESDRTQKHQILQALVEYWYKYIWPYLFQGKSAAWTAIFTLVLVVFTSLLYYVADLSERTTEATQRAFVFIQSMINSRIVDSTTHKALAYQFAAQIENSGTTPTRHGFYHLSLLYQPPPLPADFNFHDLEGPLPLVLGPKGVGTFSPFIVSQTDLQTIQANTTHLYVYGWISYGDIFRTSPPHLTEFCFDLEVMGDTTGATPPEMLWKHCPIHNCTDDDCEK